MSEKQKNDVQEEDIAKALLENMQEITASQSVTEIEVKAENVETEEVARRRIEGSDPTPRDRNLIELNVFCQFRHLDLHVACLARSAVGSGDPAVGGVAAVGKFSEPDLHVVAVVTGQQSVIERIECDLKSTAVVETAAFGLFHKTPVMHQSGKVEMLLVVQQIDGHFHVVRAAPVRNDAVLRSIQKERQRSSIAPVVRIPPEFKRGTFPARIVGLLGDDRIFRMENSTSDEKRSRTNFFQHDFRFQYSCGVGVQRKHDRLDAEG